MLHLRTPNGRHYGPISPEQIASWARQRRVPIHSVVIDEDTGESHFVEEMPQIAAALRRRVFGVALPANPPAVWGLVTAILSLPTAVLFFCPSAVGGILAIWLGVRGLGLSRRAPLLGGRSHALAAILLGTLLLAAGVLFYGGLIVKLLFPGK